MLTLVRVPPIDSVATTSKWCTVKLLGAAHVALSLLDEPKLKLPTFCAFGPLTATPVGGAKVFDVATTATEFGTTLHRDRLVLVRLAL